MPVLLRLLLISISWIVLQIGSGYLTHQISRGHFLKDSRLYGTREWERGGAIYQVLFRIRRWKDSLPEAGAMFAGGISKRKMGVSREQLEVFVAETRPAELTHRLPVPLSFFFLWNPVPVAIWMPFIGLLGNVPFIMVQRYLRPRVIALLHRSTSRVLPDDLT
ncbi:MAG: glycosyl-4,4'-diaponeurosporenoate acyltransferase [Spirochaetota bacterium]